MPREIRYQTGQSVTTLLFKNTSVSSPDLEEDVKKKIVLIGAILIASVIYFKKRRKPQSISIGGQVNDPLITVLARVLSIGPDALDHLQLTGIAAHFGLLVPAGASDDDIRQLIAAHIQGQPDLTADSGITLPPAATIPVTPTPALATATAAPTLTATASTTTVVPVTIATTTLGNGQRGKLYNAQVLAKDGSGQKHWSAIALPKGLRMNSMSGQITGKPSEYGTFHVQVTVKDASGADTKTLELFIDENGRDRNFSFPGMSGAITVLVWTLIGAVILILILIFSPFLVDRIESFREDHPGFVSRENDITNRDQTNGSGKLTIGGLEINNDGKYNNGVSVGEIRPDVPAGYLVVGDATVNGRPPDQDSTTGLITVLRKPATVIGTNESSLQKLGNTSWQQAVKVKATEMRLNGCMGGCTTIIVVDQDGNHLDY